MMTEKCKPELDRQTYQIEEQMNRTSSRLAVAETAVLELTDRIKPICSEPSPEVPCTAKEAPEYLVPLADDIRRLCDRVSRITDAINDVIYRIEL